MSACRYRVKGVLIERNIRGHEMRRLLLEPLPSLPFGDPTEKGAPAPDAAFNPLVTVDFAQRFQIGDEFDLIFRERE